MVQHPGVFVSIFCLEWSVISSRVVGEENNKQINLNGRVEGRDGREWGGGEGSNSQNFVFPNSSS